MVSSVPPAPELPAFDVTLNGARVRYVDGGPRDAPAVLFVHGAGRDHAQWDAVARPLSRTHRVIALDLPGFGASEPLRGPLAWEPLAETVIDLVATLKLGRVAMAGQGSGAAIALVAAADRPEFVGRLVLLAAACYRSRAPLAERLLDVPLLGHSVRRVAGGAVLARHVGPGASSSAATWTLLSMSRTPSTIEARLPRVRAPSLVVWGREDELSHWTQGTRLAREIAAARLEILDCGHFPETERPANVETLIREFLDGQKPRGRDDEPSSLRIEPRSLRRGAVR